MKKIKFHVYNDGLFLYGNNQIICDTKFNEISKEFIEKGRLFFAYSSIREQDRMQFDNDLKVDLKLKVRLNNLINSNDVISLDNNLYSIVKIDKSRNNLFLYLSNYVDEMDKSIELYEIKRLSALQDPEIILFRKVFANVSNVISVTNAEKENADSINSTKKLKFKIKYIDELDKKDSSLRFKIKFKNDFYNIIQVLNIDENQKIIEMEGVRE